MQWYRFSHYSVVLLLTASVCCSQVRDVSLEELPARLRDGDWDHVVHYALQSRRFTKLPAIEPGESARRWKLQARIPDDAAARLNAFVASKAQGIRHAAMRAMVRDQAELHRQYIRAMHFLYEKEWASTEHKGVARRSFVAGLYQNRGHSTDTDVTAGYGVHTGLGVLSALQPATKIHRVLLVGPGLDWAPRMGLEEDSPPQSLQPYALADSLVRLGLSGAGDLQVDCVDLNPRVVAHIDSFAAGSRRLILHDTAGDAEWQNYFLSLGKAIGIRIGFDVAVSSQVANSIRAWQMNILTQRVTRADYDLVVATNVLVYFNDCELGLALSNIAQALRPGGHFLHNELRPAVEAWGRELSMPPLHARTVNFDAGRELFDSVVLHELRK